MVWYKRVAGISLLLFIGLRLMAADSAYYKQIARALTQQVAANRANPGHANYFVNCAPQDGFKKLFKNGGEYFWNISEEDEKKINAEIVNQNEALGGTEYYAIAVSIFKYADLNYDANEKKDWANLQKKTSTEPLVLTSNLHREFFAGLMQYSVDEVKLVTGSSDYIIDFFFTVFSVSEEDNKDKESKAIVSYRTYATWGKKLDEQGFNAYTLDKKLSQKKPQSKTNWVIDNIKYTAAVVAGLRNKSNIQGAGNLASIIHNYAKDISQGDIDKINELKGKLDGTTNIKTVVYLTDNSTEESKRKEAASAIKTPAAKEVVLWADKSIDGKWTMQMAVGDGEYKTSDGSDITLNPLLNAIVKIIPDLGIRENPVTAILDGIAGLIGELKVPEKYYNPDHGDYNPVPAMVYSYLSGSVIKDYVAGLNGLNYNDKYSPSRSDFAFVCGIWNGLTGTVEAIPSGVSALIKIQGSLLEILVNKDGARDKFINKVKTFNWQQVSKLSEIISGEVKKGVAKYRSNACMISYSTGQAGFVVISFFIGAGEANTVKTFIQVLDRLDATGQLMGKVISFGGKVIKPVINASGKALKFVFEEGVSFVKRIDISYKVQGLACMFPVGKLSVTLKSKIEEIADNDLAKKVEAAIDKAGGIENLPKDENGLYLVALDDVVADGEKAVAVIGVDEELSKLGKAIDEITPGLKVLARLDDLDLPNLKSILDGFDEAAKARFGDDIANLSDDALEQLESNFGLLDEWKKIDALSASAKASKKPEWLRKIQDGQEFDRIRSSSYPNNEVYLINPKDPSKYVRLDSYVPEEEIVSRKFTQFSDIQESTGINYIQEFVDKYPSGKAIIANVASNRVGGANATLQKDINKSIQGKMILEIPVQKGKIPQSVLDKAKKSLITIRDVQGKIYS